MTHVPDFYVTKAQRAFEAAYGDEDNVLMTSFAGQSVRVYVRNLEESSYPAHIDGVRMDYIVVDRLEDL